MSRNTNNSMQSALFPPVSPGMSVSLPTSSNESTLDSIVQSQGSIVSTGPGCCRFGTTISSKLVQDAVATDTAQHSGPAVPQSMQTSSGSVANSSSGGAPAILVSSGSTFLASGAGIIVGRFKVHRFLLCMYRSLCRHLPLH